MFKFLQTVSPEVGAQPTVGEEARSIVRAVMAEVDASFPAIEARGQQAAANLQNLQRATPVVAPEAPAPRVPRPEATSNVIAFTGSSDQTEAAREAVRRALGEDVDAPVSRDRLRLAA